MRAFSTQLQTRLSANGIEPFLIVEVDWTDSVTAIYVDKPIDNVKHNGLIDIVGELQFSADFRGITESSQVNVRLIDTEDLIKSIMDTVDIHKREVRIYIHEGNLDASYQSGLLFTGQINSPITWDEGSRKFECTVLSRLESAEVGFSMEEGQFPNTPENLIGQVWPLCFGTVKNVPALATRSLVAGRLARGVGVKDFTLDTRLEKAAQIICPVRGGLFGLSDGVVTELLRQSAECKKRRCEILEVLNLAYEEQETYEFETVQIFGGKKFPQAVEIVLEIAGSQFTGYFDGDNVTPTDIFTISERRHKKLVDGNFTTAAEWIAAQQEEKAERQSSCGGFDTDKVFRITTNGLDCLLVSYRHGPTFCLPTSQANDSGSQYGALGGQVSTFDLIGQNSFENQNERSKASFDAYNAIPSAGFAWSPAGSEVLLVEQRESVYIANILPSSVHYVKGFRETDNGQVFVDIPPAYYSVRLVNYQGYNVTEVVFDPPLTSRGEGWEDEVYVTLTSTIGPNPADIIKWAIEFYTNDSVDATFNTVRSQLLAFPTHFYLDQRMNLQRFIEEVAFQSRCAVVFRRGTYSLIYLASQPTPSATISHSDIDHQTLNLTYTQTEDVVTKMDISWRDEYASEQERKIILRHNVSRYGVQEEAFDWFSQTLKDTLTHNATFWLIRLSKVFRIAKFKTTLNVLKLEPLDPVTLSIPDVSPNSITGIVLECSYDSSSQTLSWTVWTPVLAGTNVAYDFAWPADVGEQEYWPTYDEREAGLAGAGFTPGFSTIAPSDHVLGGVTSDASSSVSQSSNGISASFGNPCSRGVGGFHIPDSEIFGPSRVNCDEDHGETFPSDDGKSAGDVELEGGLDGPINEPEIPDVENFGNPQTASDALLDRIAELESQVAKAEERANAANAGNFDGAGSDGPSGSGGPDGGDGNETAQTPDDEPNEDDLPGEEDMPDCTYVVWIYRGIPISVIGPDGETGETGAVGSFNVAQGGSVYRINQYYGDYASAEAGAHAEYQKRLSAVVGSDSVQNALVADIPNKPACANNTPGFYGQERVS